MNATTGPVWICAFALAFTGLGCAGPLGPAEPRPAAQSDPAREDLPPEYDYLVGQDRELEGNLEAALIAYRRALAKDPDSAELHRKMAELLARQGDTEGALHQAERAYALEPDSNRLLLGTLYRFTKRVPDAERVLTDDEGLPLEPDAAALLYGVYMDEARLGDALEAARWLVRAEPENLRAHFALARVFERLEQHDEAERSLRAALNYQADSLAVYAALARGRRQRGDREGEIAIYREVLQAYPGHHPTLVALADAQLALERVDDARITLAEISRLHPDDLRAVVRLGYLELQERNYDAAAAYFERALAANPHQEEVLYFLGLVKRRAGELEAAIEVLEQVGPGHERYADSRVQLAAIHEERREYDRALEEAERARAMAPSRELDLYVASLRAKAGDFDGAVQFLEELLAASPEDPEVLYNLGVLYGQAHRPDPALEYMRRVLLLDPNHAGALNYVGYSWAEKGLRLDEAEAMISRALEQRPDDGYITDSLGWVYYMRARPLLESGRTGAGRALLERAIVELERAAELTGGDPVISEHLGDAYLLLDDRQRALELYEEALAQEPDVEAQPELLHKLERLRRELAPR